MRVVRAVIFKEFGEIIRNRMLVFSTLLPSFLFLFIPLMVGLRGGRQNNGIQVFRNIVVRTSPELQALPDLAINQIFIFRQFTVFLLIIPVITALAIAAHSIIGEKQTRSLEPLLATPITSLQLMVAKCLAAALPSIVLTWILFAVYTIAIRLFAAPHVMENVLTPMTLALIGLICPLIAILGLSLGVIVSSRANDPRTAQQIGALIVLPIIALFTGQMQGFFLLRLPLVLGAVVVLAVIDAVVLGLGVALFDRETILVRWK